MVVSAATKRRGTRPANWPRTWVTASPRSFGDAGSLVGAVQTLEAHHRDSSEEAIQSVAESSTGTQSSTDDSLADFGANEWLVDEMYERYQRDPDSVDKAWWDFFEKRG